MNTAQKGFTLIELMIVVAIIGILAAIAIPQYQNYITKSQVSRVMGETGAIKTAVEDCVNSGKETGSAAGNCTAADLGLTASNLLGAAVGGETAEGAKAATPKVNINTDGSAKIQGKFGNNASANLKGETPKLLVWSRSTSGSWSCDTNVEAKYAPNGCTTGGTLTAF
ncbi:pilin [Psychrobacter sp. DAB_AL62B]|uniref:pilin n=1 Tax=Psychrobacter sp. DAB_AL62B TaxID=1028420 RepID=UPI0023812C2B|nr:pilin [Psychrobacter sp. DAB_AL62B]MDE4454491.1 pilin [Psychrobacter sp. DAB_AL62B]